MITLPISALANPLEGEFNLSFCGKIGNDLSINTGYCKEKKASNRSKLEIWFVPRFLIETELTTTAQQFEDIMTTAKEWPEDTPIGIFWTWGTWSKLKKYCYLTNHGQTQLSQDNLYKKWTNSKLVISYFGCLVYYAPFRQVIRITPRRVVEGMKHIDVSFELNRS